jgi:hypothetical protein
MKVLVLDELVNRAQQIAEQARGKNIDATCCSNSNEFLVALDQGKVGAIALDIESWQKGRAIYGYFGTVRRLVDIPIVFFNAPEGFTALPDRPRLDKDAILPVATPVETVVESLAAA